jgi:hypothetical protein
MEWTKTHDYLQLVMKRELETMRQLLDNINLEEQFILRKEQKYWSSMMQERNQLIESLCLIRQNKMIIMEKLESLARHASATLEDLLPSQDTNSWEILLLRDQIATLLGRMNLQTSRNAMLLHLAKAPALIAAPQRKKKISIATLPSDDYKERDA